MGGRQERREIKRRTSHLILRKEGMAKGEKGKRNKDDARAVISSRVRMGPGQSLAQSGAKNNDKSGWWEQTRVQARQNEKNFDTIGRWNVTGWQRDWQNSLWKDPRNTKSSLQPAEPHLHPARRHSLSLPRWTEKPGTWIPTWRNHTDQAGGRRAGLIKQSPLTATMKKQFMNNKTLEKPSRPKCR